MDTYNFRPVMDDEDFIDVIGGYLTCPHCDGNGCDECIDGYFEIMWDLAYPVECEWSEEKHKMAWDMGFCLIEHENQCMMLMGSCGQDNTWRIMYTKWFMQNKWLSQSDILDCISSGGHVFLDRPQRDELCKWIKEKYVPPHIYASVYAADMHIIDNIMKSKGHA